MSTLNPEVSVAARVASSAYNLLGRLGILTVVSALATVAITRALGPSGYGQYASALATWAVLGASADFGFSLMLSRDAGHDGRPERSMLRPAYQLGLAWCLVLAAVQLLLGFSAGIGTTRGAVLLILAPSMVFNGLNPARVVFLLTYRTRRLLVIDAATALLQLSATLVLLALGLGAVAVAAAVSAQSVVNGLIVFRAADRLMLPSTESPMPRLTVLRRAVPLGLMSIMTQVYFTIDLVILGWLVTGPRLGDYAVATRMLTMLTAVAGVVMTGALPALSREAPSRDTLERLVARVWHLLIVVAVPVFVVVALLAPTVIHVTVGSRYGAAPALLQILCLAGVVSVLGNLLGNLMIARRKMRGLFVQNLAAIILNIAGNVALVPHFGVAAAAWMTLATELLVCCCALISLRRELSFHRAVEVTLRPGVAIVLSAALGLALVHQPWGAAPLSALTFVVCMTGLRGWPSEFRLRTPT